MKIILSKSIIDKMVKEILPFTGSTEKAYFLTGKLQQVMEGDFTVTEEEYKFNPTAYDNLLADLINLRLSQKDYFKMRTTANLLRAKVREQIIDEKIKHWLKEKSEKQTTQELPF